ncbi:MAG TPA: MG2 domain-containing protein [Sedimentisphaerales bacterium]|nr:MG2 domain-containing protein [Sedimentisphaerales bacterium]
MNNGEKLRKELMKKDGIDPARATNAERAGFEAMMQRESRRSSRWAWVIQIPIWVSVLFLSTASVSVRLQEALSISAMTACVALLLVLCVVLLPLSLSLLCRCISRRGKLRRILAALPEYAEKMDRIPVIASGKKEVESLLKWPDVVTLGLTISVVVAFCGGWIGCQLAGYWSASIMLHCGLMAAAVVGLLVYVRVLTPLQEDKWYYTKGKEPVIWRAILRNRVIRFVSGGVVLGLFLFSTYVSHYEPDPQDTLILGQASLYSENHAGLRILVRNHATGRPIEHAVVQLAIKSKELTKRLGSFVTGSDGCISETVYVPEVPPGKYDLIVESKSRVGKDQIVKQIEITRPYRLYVTTDKPVYQPGQTLHMRAIVLNRVSLKPFANQAVVFEVEDPKGNKVFKAERTTSEYGISSADFDIAKEVNLGRYRVRVIAGDVESEKVVNIKHYVLPRFKVELSTNKPYYLPADELTGTVKANYFFGKPVSGSNVEIVGRTIFEKPADIFTMTGRTNEEGEFTFRIVLSGYFTGMPLVGGNALLEIETTVTDTAGHTETASNHFVVSQQPINIHAFAESGDIVPGVENIIYILTTYPDGLPAICQINTNGRVLTTDETGIAVFRTTPPVGVLTLDIEAKDAVGNIASSVEKIDPAGASQAFLLRTDRAVYSGGQTVNLTIVSATARQTFFLDVIKDNQTMLTKTLPVERGRGTLELDLPPGLFGTLKVNAYTITAEGQSTADSRIIYVNQPTQLQIDTSLDEGIYRPGQTAKVNFKVTDSNGSPAPAALSLSVVDEAVFYVSENRPGLLEQFFLADEELLKPAYQTSFRISPAKLLSGDDKYQNLALALFSRPTRSPDRARILDELAEKDFISPRTVERIRQDLQQSRYDNLLEDPKYAHLADVLMKQGDYTLRATTYPDKLAQTEAFRERYFGILKAALVTLVVVAFIVCTIGALSYSTIRLIWPGKTAGLGPTEAVVQRATNGIVYSYALLFFLPIVTYLTALILSSVLGFYRGEPAWVLWGAFVTNAVVVAVLTVLQFRWSLALTRFPKTAPAVGKMIVLPFLFVTHYVITRAIIIICASRGAYEDYVFMAAAASFLFTLIMYFVASTIAGKVALKYKVQLKRPRGFLEAVAVIGILIFLASMLMPALNKVKKMASRVTWASDLHQLDMASEVFKKEYPEEAEAPTQKAAPRVRRYFPETLLWQPELITDDKGEAALELATADSITTWRMNIDAVSAFGKLGNSEIGIRVFQDFFVDLDLPVVLTRNDEVSIPVLCYNYLQQPQRVELDLRAGSWCQVQGPAVQQVRLAPNEVKSAMFRIKAKQVGSHELTVVARGDRTSDAIQRRIEVRPDGRQIEDLQSGVLALSAAHAFSIPPEAIPHSQGLVLKLYPSTFSEVVEGLDSIFRMPFGCFEQTSSTTYPNVMALLYMQRTRQITPEIEVKARKFITAGYQRLLTFEVIGGGFDWFGHAPANETLTAYGILEFTDMAKVHNVDSAVIDRAGKWLMSRQNSDGSWAPSHSTETLNAVSGELRSTAYIAWALVEAGQRGSEVDKALEYLRRSLDSEDQAYTIALAANALLAQNSRDTIGEQLVESLQARFEVENGTAHISTTGAGAMYSRGQCLDIETTALATLAMMKANRHPDTIKKALTWISQQKDQFGTWYSTQATILAMKALIAGTGQALGGDRSAEVTVWVNGERADHIAITPESSDVVHMTVLTDYLRTGENNIDLKQDEQVEIPYRLIGTYWVPSETPTVVTKKELEIQVDYDRTRLAVDDVLTSNVKVTNNNETPVSMAIIDLGIPPGFKVNTAGFERLVEAGTLAKYEVTGNQCILYVRGIDPARPLRFGYELKALYPIRAMIPASKVYEYYRPENQDQTILREIEVEEISPERP